MDFDKVIDREGTNSIKYDSIEKRFGAKKGTKPLWVADMDFATPEFILKALKKVLKQEILGYPHLDQEVFESIIFWYKNRYGITLKKKEIRLMPSVLSSLSATICALSSKEDEVIIQTPVYPPFYDIVTSNGRVLVENKLQKINNRFEIDFDDLEKKISKKTKLLILCSPHNPIGRVWGKEDLKKLLQITQKHNITILSDEIHGDIIFKEFYSMLSLKGSQKSVVVFNSPTKSFNMAGVKVSYIICKEEKIKNKIDKEIKKRYIDELNCFAPVAIKSAYSKKGLKYIEKLNLYLLYNCEFTHKYLTTNLEKLKVIQNEATYLIWLDFSGYKLEHQVLEKKLLDGAKVLLNEGTSFSQKEGEKCFRINVALSFKELRKALKNIVKEFTPQ